MLSERHRKPDQGGRLRTPRRYPLEQPFLLPTDWIQMTAEMHQQVEQHL